MDKVLCSQAGDCCNAPAGLLQASIPSISWKDILESWKISWISLMILFPGKHLGRTAVKCAVKKPLPSARPPCVSEMHSHGSNFGAAFVWHTGTAGTGDHQGVPIP